MKIIQDYLFSMYKLWTLVNIHPAIHSSIHITSGTTFLRHRVASE